MPCLTDYDSPSDPVRLDPFQARHLVLSPAVSSAMLLDGVGLRVSSASSPASSPSSELFLFLSVPVLLLPGDAIISNMRRSNRKPTRLRSSASEQPASLAFVLHLSSPLKLSGADAALHVNNRPLERSIAHRWTPRLLPSSAISSKSPSPVPGSCSSKSRSSWSFRFT